MSLSEKYDTAKFISDLNSLNIVLDVKQIEQFITYYEMLVEWNQKVNLTAITEYEDVLKKHFIDSLSLTKVFDLNRDLSVIDVGTGAGFPGLALKIAFPGLQVTLLDSLNKRIHFLNEVISVLDLTGISAVHGRAEDYARQKSMREKFDLCVSRAVAGLSVLAEYCIPFVKKEGYFISYKSEKVYEEAAAAGNAVEILGGKVERKEEFLLPDSNIYRNMIVIRKVKSTPEIYPRKAGLPGKKPLS